MFYKTYTIFIPKRTHWH